MKNKSIKTFPTFSNLLLSITIVLTSMAVMTSCDEDPVKEDTPELITEVTLTFTPAGGGAVVVVTATDPDGDGVQPIAADGPISLEANKVYTLSLTLVNGLVAPTDPAYDITTEIEEEKDEHMFFFSWTNNVFANPAGNGNVDNRNDAVNYNDEDTNGLPLGLSTDWTAASATASGEFTVLLKHQPDIKSATSSSADGETDVDVTFDVAIN